MWLWILLGVVGAGVVVVAILAYMAGDAVSEYAQKSKRSEAELELRRIGRSAKMALIETDYFPAGNPSARCWGTSSPAGSSRTSWFCSRSWR